MDLVLPFRVSPGISNASISPPVRIRPVLFAAATHHLVPDSDPQDFLTAEPCDKKGSLNQHMVIGLTEVDVGQSSSVERTDDLGALSLSSRGTRTTQGPVAQRNQKSIA